MTSIINILQQVQLMAISFNREQVKKWQILNENYSINRGAQIGKGTFGVVYQGYSKIKESLIAIKEVKSTDLSQREIQTLKALSSLDHPNIMGFYGDLTKESKTYLFLQYCDKGNLTEFILKGLSELKVLKLFREMVEGMCYMNAKGMVDFISEKMHRDLKPDNILIGPQQDIKICDFGLSQTTNSIFVTGKRGTPLYSAPQVYLIQKNNTQSYSYNCDVWSAGLILYEMLVGEKLFKTVSDYNSLKKQWLMYQRGLKKAKFDKKYHPLWDYFVNCMLQFDYQKRPTFHTLLENLKKVYYRMKDNLQKGTNMIQELNFQQVNLYVPYQIQKYQILLNICETFTEQDVRIHNEFKFTCMFMCLLRYILFAKDFIRNLRYRRLKFEDKDLLNNSEQPQVQMLCDKYRFMLEQRLAFYSTQLKITVSAKILEDYCQRIQSQEIMNELEQVIALIRRYNRGEVIENNQEIAQIFQNILAPIRKRTQDYLKKYNLDQMRLYYHLLLCMLLQEKFPEGNFLKVDIASETGKIYEASRSQLQKMIESMHDRLCN